MDKSLPQSSANPPKDMSASVIIGVTGGSGSGKTTFARLIQTHLGDHFCGLISQDCYYRDQSQNFDKDGGKVNFDHPDSLEFSLLTKHLKSLKSGEDVLVPRYDFATHKRLVEATLFPSRPVIILDGILILTQSEIRDVLDFSFFIDAEEEVRFQRRLHRDVRERGRTPEGVKEQFYSQVKPMHDLFVEPCRELATNVISGEKSFGPIIQEIVFGLKNQQISLVR